MFRWLNRQPLTKLTPRSWAGLAAVVPVVLGPIRFARCANERTLLWEPNPAEAAPAATIAATPTSVLITTTPFRLIAPPWSAASTGSLGPSCNGDVKSVSEPCNQRRFEYTGPSGPAAHSSSGQLASSGYQCVFHGFR